MIGRDMVVEAEIIEQPRRRSLKAYHRHLSRIRQDSESRPSLHINPTLTFSTISAQLRRLATSRVDVERTYRIAAVDAHMGKKRTFAIQAPIKTRPSN